MTYTFKLARRLAVSRRFGVLTALVLLAACQGDSTAPTADTSALPATPTALQISPVSVTIETDQHVQFRGQTRNWRGDLVPIPVTWIATGGSIGADGIFSSKVAGTFRIAGRGRRGRQADSSTVVVVHPASDLVRISVTPKTARVDARAQRAFTVTGFAGDGSTKSVGVTWAATGGEVDPSGVYTAGTTAGTYKIIAANTAGTMTDTVDVTVSDAPAPPADPTADPPADPPATPPPADTPPPAATLAAVTVLPVSVSLTSGNSAQFRAYGRNSVGDSVPVSVVFTGSGGTITSSGLYTAGQTAGTYRVVATASGLADTSVVTLTRPSAPPPPPPPSGVGIPFGPASLWQTSVNRVEPVGSASFSLSIVGTSGDRIVGLLAAAKAARQQVVLNMTGGVHTLYLTNGAFDLAKWKAKMDAYNTPAVRSAVAAAVADGTIIGNSVMDEPNVRGLGDGNTWGPVGTMTKQRVDELCGYVKAMFPTMAVGVVHGHATFEPTKSYRVCEFIVDAYSSRLGTVTEFRDAGLALAARDNINIIFSMNILNGGSQSARDGTWSCAAGTTGGRGTYDPNCRMTPAQVREFGQVLGVAGCAMLMWKYDAGFMAKPENQQAFRDIAARLATVPRKSCARR